MNQYYIILYSYVLLCKENKMRWKNETHNKKAILVGFDFL